MNEPENDFIKQFMRGFHDFEVKMAETIGEIRGDLKSLTDAVKSSIIVDTKRLDDHSKNLDDHRSRIDVLEEWREGKEKQDEQESKKTTHRIAIWNTITIVVAVALAYVFQKLG